MTRHRLSLLIVIVAVIAGAALAYADRPTIDVRWVLVPGFAIAGSWGLVRGERARQQRARRALNRCAFREYMEQSW